MSYYFKVINSDFTWPFGSHGPLVVNSGALVTLEANQVYDFSSITIENGGILQFTQSQGGWTILGCAGDAIINGTIQAINGGHNSGNFTAYAPASNGNSAGEELTYSIVQSTGGSGGGSDVTGGYIGGTDPGPYGNGGGGGGFGAGVNGSIGKGGDGSINTEQQAGGLGALVFFQNGTNGPASSYQNTGMAPYGGGGGGGSRGLHGTGLYLRAQGSILGSGTITVAGQNGGKGGNGGSATDSAGSGQAFYSGGGGGGGAGGSGGSIVLRYKGTFSNTLTLGAAEGMGGSGGAAGSVTGTGGSIGVPGSTGQNGSTGSINYEQIS
jgi:hypothetical protein